MIVAYPSTPAQYFHMLRRQALRRPRRPLVLMQPKSLLRMPAAASKLEDLATGTFQPVIDDPTASANREQVQRLVFCTGKMYYDLIAAARRPANVAIIRVEELAPWPREVARRSSISIRTWTRWCGRRRSRRTWARGRTCSRACARRSARVTTLRYIGRPERASPAEGYKATHDAEQARIVNDVLTYAPAPRRRRERRD